MTNLHHPNKKNENAVSMSQRYKKLLGNRLNKEKHAINVVSRLGIYARESQIMVGILWKLQQAHLYSMLVDCYHE